MITAHISGSDSIEPQAQRYTCNVEAGSRPQSSAAKLFCRARFVLFLLIALVMPRISAATTAMIFCNGDMGSVNGLTASQINGLRASGMTTIVVFTMGVAANGDFTYGGVICSNGVYVGPSNWGALLNQCRVKPSSVTRIEMCIGAWGDSSWTHIKDRIAADGTNSNTVLYKNLLALKNALGIDAICNDDESAYHSASAIQFGKMCGAVGLKLTLCPYTRPTYWQAVKAGLGDICDAVYLQCYDGGAGNNPATWNTYFGGLKVIPGYWDWERDTTFLTKMQAGKNAGCTGGFYWPSCTGCNPPADANGMKQYADWILKTFNPTVTPATASEVVGGEASFTVDFSGEDWSYQWKVVRGGMTNDIPGATTNRVTLANLQLTNTASYFAVLSNATGVSVSSAGSLTVSSLPAAVNGVIASFAAQTGLGSVATNFVPTWNVRPGSLIAGQLPNTVGSGNFGFYGASGALSVLTDNSFGWLNFWPNVGGSPSEVTCGTVSGGAGQFVTYHLGGSDNGYTLTNIMVYGGWGDAGRDQQAFTIYYSTVTSPATFLPLRSVNFNPANPLAVQSATRTTLMRSNGALATNVVAVKFDFTTPPAENGYCGYSEIAIYGFPTLPLALPTMLSVNFQSGDDFIVNVEGLIAGRGYLLQSRTNLSSGDWITEWEFVAAQPTMSLTNSLNHSGEKFYRIIGFQ